MLRRVPAHGPEEAATLRRELLQAQRLERGHRRAGERSAAGETQHLLSSWCVERYSTLRDVLPFKVFTIVSLGDRSTLFVEGREEN